MKHKKLILFFCLLFITFISLSQQTTEADICIYGGTSAGIIAAYTAKQLHHSVILIEPGRHVGGLSSGGLGYTDIGNKYVITGVARDFYRRIGKHYNKFEQWIFEPHIAEEIFKQYLEEASVNVLYEHRIVSAKKENNFITEIRLENSKQPNKNSDKIIKAKMFIDCSYEGDLMAKAGVSYIIGREPNSFYNETYNGVQLRDKHQFPDGVDPYKISGKPESGLLWGISKDTLAAQGTGDKKVQAYNFRICLTNKRNNLITITRPDDYDSSRYELLLRVLEKNPANSLGAFLKIDMMPGNKTDINNNGAFSTDMIGMNYEYPDADYKTRSKIFRAHENYVKGLLYFIGHDSRMPQHLRNEMLQWGYPRDEYDDNDHWSPQMYVREARRMIGAYVMTQANCEGKLTVTDGIGMAAYTMDSHNCERIITNGMVKNEGDVQIGGFGPYPVSYRAIISKETECKNLLVPVCLSASHIAYGSIRMEPVFMVLAQSASTAAALAIQSNISVQQVDVSMIQNMSKTNPLANGSTPEILVDNDDSIHVIINGHWTREKSGAYGESMFVDSSKGTINKSVRFIPDIIKEGKYKLYVYFAKLENMSSKININIFDGEKKMPLNLSADSIKVEGQTSGEWVYLGNYKLSKGKNAYVEITNENADGIVVADAVLFIPE